ncbi:MAG: aminopeptidase P family protein [Reichenbachiella sp.]|uniref:aminopeptidase P family protein n=1 Tax=Reichenbachiella sp. TaxID=2184521 RepID=UPI0032652B08
MKKTFGVLLLAIPLLIQAQPEAGPKDLLKSDFHKEKRAELRAKMPDNSVAVFFSNAIRNRANDVDFLYHQDPNFFYLTGHKEPHSVLMVFKETQNINDNTLNEIIFVRGHDVLRELYDGPRLGKDGADDKLAIQVAFENPSFKDFNIDFSKFDKVLFYDFKNDVRNTEEEGDLFDLIEQFKQKSGYKQGELAIEPQKNNLDVVSLDRIMRQLRGVKTKEELDLIRKAVDISTIGQREVMKAMKPGMSEAEIQGIHEFVFKKYGAEYEGYPSIVGAGNHGCILHYIDNYKPAIEDGELILMDLGAEYHGYTADVTRTIPVNGTFTKEQKLIYDLVYEAQQAAADSCKAGLPFTALYETTAKIVNEGLVELGLYKSLKDEDIINPETGRNRYYPHGCCHHIGLDVHDKGLYGTLEENMTITIEPGIYIPKDSPADKKWWDIPVRIEDDYLITKDGCELLSDKAPRRSDEIEKLMKETSIFTDYELPPLKSED